MINNCAEIRATIAGLRAVGGTIGFVPTMGALHAGHLSLVDTARRACDHVVVSIFVNPLQFGPNEDYTRYPRDLGADLAQLAPYDVDVVFAPEAAEMYRPDSTTTVEVAGVSAPLEGEWRNGHFRGVATVVLKLFNLVTPDAAFFGQKDYQQSLVVRRMVSDLDLPVAIRICPTVREADGLALSSRNAYLSADDRRRALALSRSLARAGALFAAGERDAKAIEQGMRELLAATDGITIDYAAVADPDTLAEVSLATADSVALVAARVGGVRLIDNCRLGEPPKIAAD